MRRLARLAVPLGMLVSATLLLAACQAQPAPPAQAPAGSTPAAAAPTSAPAAPVGGTAPAAATKAPGAATSTDMDPNQEWRTNLSGEPENLDPNMASWDTSIAVIELVFDGMFKFDKDLKLQPGLAKELPTAANGGISAYGKTYTIKLRDGLKYSDGKPLMAKDVVFSVKRMLDPTMASEYASFYYGIVGAEELNTSKETDAAKLQALKDAVGVKAVDNVTVEFKLKEARASFTQLLAMWPVTPVSEEVIKSVGGDKPNKWTEDPKTYIGHGPYKITEWVHQDHITLVPNENYWGPAPKLKKITLAMVTDSQADYAGYMNGERELTMPPTALFAQVMSDPNLSKQLVRSPRLSTFAFQFNHAMKPFDNVNVRKAFITSIDKNAFIDKLRQGVGKPAYSWIPPGQPGYQPDLGKMYSFDAAKAKQYLADAGFANGQGLPKITFQYANTRNNPIYAQFLQEQWKTNLGIDVTLEPMEPKAFSAAVNNEQYMMGFYGWNADYPDPDNWLPELFGTGAGNNHTNYSNPKLDDLMKKAIAEPDEQKRLAMWAEAQKIVVEDDVVIGYLYHDENFLLVKPYVKDMFFTAMDGSGLPGRRSYGQISLGKK